MGYYDWLHEWMNEWMNCEFIYGEVNKSRIKKKQYRQRGDGNYIHVSF